MSLRRHEALDRDHGPRVGADARRRLLAVVLLLFAAARVAAGTGREELVGRTVGDVLDEARARHGAEFADVLATARIWVNGSPAAETDALAPGDEVAVLPPVSGGCAR